LPDYLKKEFASITNAYPNRQFEYGNWSNIAISGGPTYSLPIRKFVIDIRPMLGFLMTTRPYIREHILDKNGIDSLGIRLNSGKGYSLLVHPMISVLYPIFRRQEIIFSASFSHAKPKIEMSESSWYYYNPSINGYIYQKIPSFNYVQTISIVNLQLGIVFHLNNSKA
jgi:hypothetical protein